MGNDRIGPPSDSTRSEDAFVWALWTAGGADHTVDVEDIFLRCFELAPTKFAWRTKADLPDYKKCAKALQTVEAKTHVGALSRHGQYHRMLTPAGVAWCERNSEHLERLYGVSAHVAPHAGDDRCRLVREVRASDAFTSWTTTRQLPATIDLADALRCSVGSNAATWAARASQLATAARAVGDADVERFALLVHDHHGGRNR